MATLNGFPISDDLLKLSKIIQDIREDCKEEEANNYHISSLTITKKTLRDLHKIFSAYRGYQPYLIFKQPEISVERDTLQLAIDLNMRSLFGRILFFNMREFEKHFEKWDNILACLECCNGQAYKLLQDLWKLKNISCSKLCMFNIQKFVEMEGDNELALLEITTDMSFEYIVVSKNFVPKLILPGDKSDYRAAIPDSLKSYNREYLGMDNGEFDESADMTDGLYDYVTENVRPTLLKYMDRNLYLLINDVWHGFHLNGDGLDWETVDDLSEKPLDGYVLTRLPEKYHLYKF